MSLALRRGRLNAFGIRCITGYADSMIQVFLCPMEEGSIACILYVQVTVGPFYTCDRYCGRAIVTSVSVYLLFDQPLRIFKRVFSNHCIAADRLF